VPALGSAGLKARGKKAGPNHAAGEGGKKGEKNNSRGKDAPKD